MSPVKHLQLVLIAALLSASVSLVAPGAIAATDAATGDAVRGAKVYTTCSDCHALDENEMGPKHRHLFGRRAGSVADYAYSPALRQSGIVWDERTLDKWLANPQALVPGAKMFFSLHSAQDRADVIEYLKHVNTAGN
ncbi:MAG TPA: c-type cytochrome [Spongiibacteraceae bacterium]|nr:c-type cytochrome [Spongiibacteraceae bacterium]